MPKLEPVVFSYRGEDYTFEHSSEIQKGEDNKICFGKFKGKAPVGLNTSTEYCLKLIHVTDPSIEPCAACRECYDLVRYPGAHLREILFQDTKAALVEKGLRAGHGIHTDKCIIVEPYYYSLKNYFTNCNSFPVKLRLDIVLQFALGSQELSNTSLGGRRILAHRDLKWQNGVAEYLPDGTLRVRLTDFATIVLGEDAANTYAIAPSSTMKLAISEENTSPESILDDLQVSSKTDVYALGMMLASLFMRGQSGKYVNPNEILIKTVTNWGDPKILKQAMTNWRKAAKELSDPGSSWIENQLNKAGIAVQWDFSTNDTPYLDPFVYREVRALFWDSTRFEPKNRIDRDEFIERLRNIIDRVQTPRQPVSIYLFNRADADRYKEAYVRAALNNAYAREVANAKESHKQAPQVLCVSYATPAPGVPASSYVRLLSDPLGDRNKLADCIRSLTPAPQSSVNMDMLLYALFKAGEFLDDHQEQYTFTGNVYLFTPAIPLPDEIVPLKDKNGTELSAISLCRAVLDPLAGRATSLFAFSPAQPRTGVDDWWDHQVLDTAPAPKPEDSESDSAAGNRAVHNGSRLFDVSPKAPYVTLPDGRKVYIGILKN